MTFLDEITVLILTYNEEANIERTLRQLTWANRIVIVDSGSTDGTLEIIASVREAEVVRRPFDDFASQCNFGLSQISSEWVLSLDADYELSDAFISEMSALEPRIDRHGYQATFIYRIYGRRLRASLYPPRTVLYRKLSASYHNEGHGHRVSVKGAVGLLKSPIFHDDRKPLSRWFSSQQRYAREEAAHLLKCGYGQLSRIDQVRLMGWPAPPLVFLYCLLLKRCVLDGWPGWLYVMQRLLAETMLAIEIVDRRLRQPSD